MLRYALSAPIIRTEIVMTDIMYVFVFGNVKNIAAWI